MNVVVVIIAAAVVGIIGLVIGLLLGVAGEKFKVEVDEREVQIRDLLPGNNCGGCGYAGCDALAKAILVGEAQTNACPVGGPNLATDISAIMGVEARDKETEIAYVKCAGTCEVAKTKYEYFGAKDCNAAMMVPGQGPKSCGFGCLGLGSCVSACPFDAIHMVDGIAVVDKETCVACGKCIKTCPKQLIELIPYSTEYAVKCTSKEKGKMVKDNCSVGCIGCGLCVRVCETKAITVTDNIAYIDQALCTKCGNCAQKCPVKIIHL